MVDVPVAELLDDSGQLVLHPDIQSGRFFQVSLKQSELRLLARGYVGYVPLTNDLVVYIHPRVPVANLGRIAQVAGYHGEALSLLRDYQTEGDWNDSLTDIYAAALADQVAGIRTQGMLREYVRREEVTSTPRGRLLVAPTVHRLWSRGVRHRAVVSWFERTMDNSVNQCLKYAVWTLAQDYQHKEPLRGQQRRLLVRLNSAFNELNGVTLRRDVGFLVDPLVTGARPLPATRGYYRSALDIAVSVITRQSIDLGGAIGPVRMASVVLDMNELFEAYVRRSLERSAAFEGWVVRVVNGNEPPGRQNLFSDNNTHKAKPDVVLRASDGATPLVIDVKNIPLKDQGKSPRDAIEQVAAYALSYGTNEVLLVHPKARKEEVGGLHHLGQLGPVRVWQYRFDLSVDDLAAEDAAFAAALAANIPGLIPPA